MPTEVQAAELELVFRTNMRTRRKELKLTQAEVAERIKANQPYVAALEAGARSPQLETIAKVAEALATTPDALLTPGIFSTISG